MGSGLILYGLASIVSGTGAIAHALITRKQFFNAAIYLTTAKVDILILGNLACLLTLLLAKGILKAFLGRLRGFEVENLVDNGKYMITETCLALTTFRQEIDFSGVFLFGSLLFLKCFHWLLTSRIEHVGRSHSVSPVTHIRLAVLLCFLAVCDIVHISAIVSSGSIFSVMSGQLVLPTVHLLFAFEFTMLLLSLFVLALQYLILIIDTRYDGQWERKPVLTFYVDIIHDLIRVFMYAVFFIIIGAYFGIPLHLIRELYVAFHTFKDRLSNYMRYKRLMRNLNERFPDATPEQIAERSDDQCIICREVMVSGKALPCSHLFHFHCLRTWLERSNTCPICRAAIPDLTEERRPIPAHPVAAPVPAPVEIPPVARTTPGTTSLPESIRVAHRSLLQKQTLAVQKQIDFHNQNLRELSSIFEHLLDMQRQLELIDVAEDNEPAQDGQLSS